MIDYFKSIIDFFTSLVSFVGNLISGMFQLLVMIPKAGAFLHSISGYIPSVLTVFITVAISISVVFLIIDR